MNVDKDKDIVGSVFGREVKSEDRVSALFTSLNSPEPLSSEQGREDYSVATDSSADFDGNIAKDEQYQSGRITEHGFGVKAVMKNINILRYISTIVLGGLAVLALLFFLGTYLGQEGKASTETVGRQRSAMHVETVSPAPVQPVPDITTEPVLPEPIPTEITEASPLLELPPVITWHRLLKEISSTMPKTVQICTLQSDNASQLVIEGKALSADSIRTFVDSLRANSQLKSPQISAADPGDLDSKLLTFSVDCDLAAKSETAEAADDEQGEGVVVTESFFTFEEAGEFFDSIEPLSEDAGCMVKSFVLSAEDARFHDELDTSITKRTAAVTLLGGYRNILTAMEKLQDSSHSVRLDSVSIRQDDEAGGLQCSIGISLYAIEDAESDNQL